MGCRTTGDLVSVSGTTLSESSCFLQAPAPSGGSQATYVKKETQYAWECIQTQCQKVLVMLLHGQASGAAAAAAGGGLSKGKDVAQTERRPM